MASRRAVRDALDESSRYELLVKIASGGMATVHVGRSRSAIGRLFAIKRAHPHLADDPGFRSMFVAEARLAARIHHPNVVAVQDVEELDEELLLVMDYIEGISLAEWLAADVTVDAELRARVAVRIVLDACAGLHAAHELVDEGGRRLEVVHRDVSPQNILLGRDGIARVTDFGIAKSLVQTAGATSTGSLKGKLAYMCAEYIELGKVDRRADVFALGVVTWEALTGTRLFKAASEAQLMSLVLACDVPAPSTLAPLLAPLDAAVLRATRRAPDERWPTVHAFAEALEAAAEAAGLVGTRAEVTRVVEETGARVLSARRDEIRARVDGGAGRSAGPELEPLEIVEPSRTHTLDGPLAPTVAAPARAVPAAPGPAGANAPSGARWWDSKAMRGASVALAAAVATLAFWQMRERERERERDRTEPGVVEVAAATTPGATAPAAPVGSASPPAPPAGSAPVGSARADADGGVSTSRPKISPTAHPPRPRGSLASPDLDPPAPTRAPPSPYKSAGH